MVTFNNNLHSYIFKQRKRVRGMFFFTASRQKIFHYFNVHINCRQIFNLKKISFRRGSGEAIFLSPNKIFNTGTIIFGIGGRIRPSTSFIFLFKKDFLINKNLPVKNNTKTIKT